jgi:hypothetical protein
MVALGFLLAAASGELPEQHVPAQAAESPSRIGPSYSPDDREDLERRLLELERELERIRLRGLEGQGEAAPQPPAPVSTSPNVFNPTLTVIGNGLYRYDDRPVFADGDRIDKQVNLREVEIDLRAAVDPFADAVVIGSFESVTPGEFEVGIEEGYVIIKRLPVPLLDEPPLGLKLKAGRFRTETGRINRLHLHDLPQASRPLVIEEFFGEEGFIADGLSAQMFLPTPFDEASALELTAQALSGGGVAVADGPARSLGVVGNLRWFRTFASAHNVDLSLIAHFGRTDPKGELSAVTYGADVLYKWKPLRGGEFRSVLLGGELLYSDRDFLEPLDTDGDGRPDTSEKRAARPFGYFVFAQYQLARSLYVGPRWDDTRSIDDDRTRRRAVSGYLTWYASEFLRFRVGYEHRFSDVSDEDGRDSAFAELNFVFGAHPPEPFWVSR